MLSYRERSGAGSLATPSAIGRDDYPATKVIEEPFCAGLGPEKRHKADASKCLVWVPVPAPSSLAGTKRCCRANSVEQVPSFAAMHLDSNGPFLPRRPSAFVSLI